MATRKPSSPVLFTSQNVVNRKALLQNSELPFGCLFTPFKPVDPQPPLLRYPPSKCTNCSSFLCPSSRIDSENRRWRCIFCDTHSDLPQHLQNAPPNVSSECPELMYQVVDFYDTNVQPPSLGQNISPVIVFVIDCHVPDEELQHLCGSILSVLASLPPATLVGLVTFSNIIAAYQLAVPNVASADIFPGIESLTDQELRRIMGSGSLYIARLDACLPTLTLILGALRSIASLSSEGEGTTPVVFAKQRRALGVATEVAMALIEQESIQYHQSISGRAGSAAGSSPGRFSQPPPFGRVITCLSGPPNFGPGAVPADRKDPQGRYYRQQALSYYQKLALRASQQEIGIDIFCVGLYHFEIPILQHLVYSNGGLCVIQKSFGEEFKTNLWLCMVQNYGRGGSFDVYSSAGLVVNQIIGPARADEDAPEDTPDCLTKVKVGRVTPSCTFTVLFQLTEDVVADSVDFQFVVRFYSVQNQFLIRVFNFHLPVTGNIQNFVRSMNVDVTAVVLAKRFVLTARKLEELAVKEGRDSSRHGVESVHQELQSTLRNIALKFGNSQPGSSRPPDFPAELRLLPEYLFFVIRGPLLGSILQHPDDIDALRSFFLIADFEDSARILRPRLWVARWGNGIDGIQLQDAPLETLSLQPNHILLFDHYTDIYIWSGIAVSKPDYESVRIMCRQAAQELLLDRYPTAQLLEFIEGSSMARWLSCRLIPSHKDSTQEQLTRSMGGLSVSHLQKTDDLSLREFYASLFR